MSLLQRLCMIMNKISRSPLFYVGDKYKLMKQILPLFPREINCFYEPFCGGGTVFLNVISKKYFLNDINKHLISIHNLLIKASKNPGSFFNNAEKIIYKYNLSRSFKEDIIPRSLKQKWEKTYFARFNKKGYGKLREYANYNKKNDPLILYILLIYGFNRMLRFNAGGYFNLPVGNVDFNNNVVTALNNYFKFVRGKSIKITANDFEVFFADKDFIKDDFVYFDPPYLITGSEYNKIWNEKSEISLLTLIDKLNKKKVKFALSNVTHYNGTINKILIKWMKKYSSHNIESHYINYHHNGIKEIKEVLITNF